LHIRAGRKQKGLKLYLKNQQSLNPDDYHNPISPSESAFAQRAVVPDRESRTPARSPSVRRADRVPSSPALLTRPAVGPGSPLRHGHLPLLQVADGGDGLATGDGLRVAFSEHLRAYRLWVQLCGMEGWVGERVNG
jgi:hypothetical protein